MSARDNQAAELRQEVLDTTRLLLEAVDKLEVANHERVRWCVYATYTSRDIEL